MRKRLPVLLSLCCLAAGATAILAMGTPAPQAHGAQVAADLSPTAQPPAEPAPQARPDKGSQDQGLGQDGDLFAPKPEPRCLTGWCSSNQQCIDWTGDPSAVCIKQKGATCGHCSSLN